MVADNNPEQDPPKLRPDMASLRLIILKFTRDYIRQWGASPSYGEISHGCDTNRTRVKRAIRSLAKDGLINHQKGPRGISLPDEEQTAIRQLRRMGYQIDAGSGEPLRLTGTKRTLLPPPKLDYEPSPEKAEMGHGAKQSEDRRARRAG